MKYGYARVLTDDQTPALQLAALKAADAKPSSRMKAYREPSATDGPEPCKMWLEDRESATTLQRDAFQKLQAAIFAGKIDTVVVWKLDRPARNLKEGVNVLADWCQRGVRVIGDHATDRPQRPGGEI